MSRICLGCGKKMKRRAFLCSSCKYDQDVRRMKAQQKADDIKKKARGE